MGKSEDSKLYENLLKQAMQLWINPEIERKKKEGLLGKDFQLSCAQIIFYLGHIPTIRLNNEVKVTIKAKINRSIKKGEIFYERDIEEIQNMELLDEGKDFGHLTFVRFKNYWIESQLNSKITIYSSPSFDN